MRALSILFLPILAVALLAPSAQAQAAIALGSQLPAAGVSLDNVNGPATTLQARMGSRGLAVIFWSPACPWVQRSEERIIRLGNRFQNGGVNFVLVNSNDPGQAANEGAEHMRQQAGRSNYAFPYLVDSSGQVARAFGAARAPQIFLFDSSGRLVYEGGLDDSPSDAALVENHFFQEALEAVLAGRAPANAQTRAFGCSIRTARP